MKARLVLLAAVVVVSAGTCAITVGLMVLFAPPAEAVPRCEYNSPYVCKSKLERACGKVGVWSEGVRASARVFAKRVSCLTARKVIRRGSLGKSTGRWRPVIGSGEGAVYVKGGSSYHGPKLRWKRYVRSSNLLRRSLQPVSGTIVGHGSTELRRFCGNNPRWPWVSGIMTRKVSCNVAYRITKRHGKAGNPCWSRGICWIQGFRCRVTGSYPGWSSHKCKRGPKVIRFKNGG